MDLLIEKVAEHGVLGLIIAVLMIMLVAKDRALARETAARISDAKVFTDLALRLQGQSNDSISKMGNIFEEVKRTMRESGGRRSWHGDDA